MSRARSASASSLPPNLVEVLQDSFVENNFIPAVRQALIYLANEDPDTPAVRVEVARGCLETALEAVETGALVPAQQDALATEPVSAALFLGFVYLVTSAVRGRVPEKVIVEDLKKMGFSASYDAEFISKFNAKRADIEAAALTKRITLPGLDRLDWRVDVAITTTHLVRAFKPTVTFQVTASDGRIHTFESSVDKFHQNIEQHPTLKRLVD